MFFLVYFGEIIAFFFQLPKGYCEKEGIIFLKLNYTKQAISYHVL